jgi:hypothetical protein
MIRGGFLMSKEIKCFGRCWARRECLKAIGGVAVGTLALASGIVWLRRAGKKSPYELGQDAVVEYQKLSRPKIEELLGAENYDRCCTDMLTAYDEFAPRLPILDGENNRATFYANAPFMLSLYRTLLGEFAYSQDEALDLLSQITCFKVRKDYEENRPITRFFMSRVAESEFVRKLTMKRFEWEDEEYGWASEFPESDAYIAVDMTRCGLVKWFREQGVPEIAPIACEGDFVWAEFMTGLELRRTKTLAEGDDVCDFRYVKEQA